MPRYLADLLGGWPGFRPADNDTEGATPEGYATALGGAGTVRGKTNLLDPDPSFYDDAGAGGGETVAPLRMGGFSSGMGQPYRTPVRPDYLQGASAMAALDKARLAPVTPGPPAHGTAGWMPPSERGGPGVPPPMAPGVTAPRGPPGAAPPMPQQARGAQPLMPSGAPNLLGKPRSSRGNLLGNWLNAPIMNQERGTSRMMAIGQLLSGVGAGMANGGGIGGGIQELNRTLADIQKNERAQMGEEEERQYRRLEMELKRKQLEQKAAPRSHVLSAGGMLVGPDGEVLARADTAKKAATSAEAALLDPNTPPEIKAQARQLLQQENEPSERDRAYIASLERSGQHQKAMEEIARIRANKPGGSASAPAPTQVEKLIAFRDKLPPGHPDRAAVEAAIKKETTFATASGGSDAAGTTAVPGYVPATPAARNDAAKKIEAADAALTKLNSFTATFKPELQTAASSASTSIGRMLEWAGIPLSEERKKSLATSAGQTAAIGEIAGEIRHSLYGAGLTGPEIELAEQFIPVVGDPPSTIQAKMAKLTELATSSRNRNFEIYSKGISEKPPAAAEEPPATDVSPPAEGMSLPDYARLLHRNGMTVEQARAAAEAAFKDQK